MSSHSSPSSTSSRRRLPSQHHDSHDLKPQPIKLHPYLQKTQAPITEQIHSYVLWDVRENPLTAALLVQAAGPIKLPEEFLNQYATDPPVPFLKVMCELPNPWSIDVHASHASPPVPGVMGGSVNTNSARRSGVRNSLPPYPPPMSTSAPTHVRSSSSPRRYPVNTPHTPTMSTIPLPESPAPNQPRIVGVTIFDVIIAIYHHLHKPVDPLKLDAVQPKQRARIMESFQKRLRMTQGGTDGEFVLGSPTSPIPPAFSTYHAPAMTSYPPFTSTPTFTSTHSAGAEGVKLVDFLTKLIFFGGMEVDLDNRQTIVLSVKQPH